MRILRRASLEFINEIEGTKVPEDQELVYLFDMYTHKVCVSAEDYFKNKEKYLNGPNARSSVAFLGCFLVPTSEMVTLPLLKDSDNDSAK